MFFRPFRTCSFSLVMRTSHAGMVESLASKLVTTAGGSFSSERMRVF
jgi:hypothetical protein